VASNLSTSEFRSGGDLLLFTSRNSLLLPPNRQQVLVWDENAAVRRFLHEFVQSFGYSVLESPATVADLLSFVDRDPSTLIVISANAHTVALQVAGQVRRKRPRTSLIVCTTLNEIASADPFFAIGVSAVIERSTTELGKIVAALEYVVENPCFDVYHGVPSESEAWRKAHILRVGGLCTCVDPGPARPI
jgi:CheY-like chemotaxis protein